MRWKVKPHKSIFEWHSWFAWYPVTVYSAANKCDIRVWLEPITRLAKLGVDGKILYEYRLVPEEFYDIDSW